MQKTYKNIEFYVQNKRSGALAKGLRVSYQGGQFYFQCRYSLDGKSVNKQIGKFPDVTLHEALQIAQAWEMEVKAKRLEKKRVSFSSEIAHGKTKVREARGGLRSLKDLVFFYKKIEDLAASDLRNYWLLQLNLPNMGKQLLELAWSDINLVERSITLAVQTKVAMKGYRPELSFRNLPNVSLALGGQRNKVISGADGNLVFQQLLDRDGADAEALLSFELKRIWPDYPLSPKSLAHVAKKIARTKSNFRSEFIEKIFEDSFWNGDISAHDRICLGAFYEWWHAIVTEAMPPYGLKASRKKVEMLAAQALKY